MQNNHVRTRNRTTEKSHSKNKIQPNHYRYTVLGLLFLATCINYIDRQIIGLLKPILEDEFNWTESDYADIVFWFQVLYATGYYLNGKWIDQLGAKTGYSLAVFFWSIAAIAHALIQNLFGFKVVRGALGFFESGNFPAAIKAIAEWFPKEDRSFATGVMISGTTVGAALAPGIVLWLAQEFGWRTSFLITGSLGLLWVLAWLLVYRKPRAAESAVEEYRGLPADHRDTVDPSIHSKKISTVTLLKQKPTLALISATFLTDHVWWFYLFWLPSYLAGKGLNKTEIALPLTIVYLVTAGLSIVAGWISSFLLKRGWSLNRTRKLTMLWCTLMVSGVVLFRFYEDVWLCTIIISIAAAAQSIWKASLLTSVTDLFPASSVSTVLGIVGFAGAVGGMMAVKTVGYVLDQYKLANKLESGYHLIFISCSCLFLIAFCLFHLLSPKLTPFQPNSVSEKVAK